MRSSLSHCQWRIVRVAEWISLRMVRVLSNVYGRINLSKILSSLKRVLSTGLIRSTRSIWLMFWIFFPVLKIGVWAEWYALHKVIPPSTIFYQGIEKWCWRNRFSWSGASRSESSKIRILYYQYSGNNPNKIGAPNETYGKKSDQISIQSEMSVNVTKQEEYSVILLPLFFFR